MQSKQIDRKWLLLVRPRKTSGMRLDARQGTLSPREEGDMLQCSKASRRPHVVIVGAGFGGLTAAQALADAPVDVTVVDRHNYHLFQPLLYQVATAGLSPGEIAQPIRSILRRYPNVSVVLG